MNLEKLKHWVSLKKTNYNSDIKLKEYRDCHLYSFSLTEHVRQSNNVRFRIYQYKCDDNLNFDENEMTNEKQKYDYKMVLQDEPNATILGTVTMDDDSKKHKKIFLDIFNKYDDYPNLMEKINNLRYNSLYCLSVYVYTNIAWEHYTITGGSNNKKQKKYNTHVRKQKKRKSRTMKRKSKK